MTKYVPLVAPTFAPYGGKYLAAGEKIEGLEGAPPAKRVAILQFPSMEKARAWRASPEYGKIMRIREPLATIRAFLVEGRAPQP